MCPIGGALFDGFSRGLTACLVCHCLLIETNQGLVLIDTGFGQRDIKAPLSRFSPFFMNLNRIKFEQKYTAVAAIEQLGLNPRDVRLFCSHDAIEFKTFADQDNSQLQKDNLRSTASN